MKKILSNDEFNAMLCFEKMEYLEKCSQLSLAQLSASKKQISDSDLRNNYPAFRSSMEPEKVIVKFPTYRIDVTWKEEMGKNGRILIEKLLISQRGKIWVYEGPDEKVICLETNTCFNIPSVFVLCFCDNLKDNFETKDETVEILEKHSFIVRVSPWVRYVSI